MTRFAIGHRIAVFVMVFGVVVAGSIAYGTLPREAAPDILIPNIIVTVPYIGVAPDDIESLVTNPLERRLSDVKDLDVMTSTSAEGAAMINLKFTPDVDIGEALQRVRDKVDEAGPDLPPEAEDPIINEISISDFPIIVVSVSGSYGLDRLKKVAESIEDQVERIPGVTEARVTGGREREIQVNVDPRKLHHYGLALKDLVNAVRDENVNIPGGSVESGALRYLVRVPAEFEGADSLAKITVKTVDGQAIRLANVATVSDAYEELAGYSRLRGRPSVSVSIMKRAGGNMVEIVDRAKAIIEELRPDFPKGTHITYLADQSVHVRRMVRELENSIASGLVLVLLVLFLFLGVRNSFFVALAIPLSMLIAFLVLSAMSITLNMIVLFSLILALGMLVDNAIVVVENIYRHSEMGKELPTAALDGTMEVAWPVITSTVTTLCAFLPLLFWEGIMGEFMGYLPLTLIITLSASLFVALVANPVICATFLSKGARRREGDERSWVIRGYRAALGLGLKLRWLVVLGAFSFLAATIWLYGRWGHGTEFFPETTPEKVFVNVNAPAGTHLDASDAIVRRVEHLLEPLDNVDQYAADVGVGGGQDFGASATTPNKSRITVDFQEKEERTESPWDTIATLRKGIDRVVAGADVEIKQEDMGPPAGPPVNIEISGEDYDLLTRRAATVKRAIRDVLGLANLRDNAPEARPELQIRVNRDKARQLGLKNTRDVAWAVRTAVNGEVASKFRVYDDEHDIRVRLAEPYRDSLTDIRNLEVYGEHGVRIPLRLVAEIDTATGSGSIRHKDQKRVVTVSAEVEGRNANEALADAQEILSKVDLPGVKLSFTGENEEQDKAQAFLSKALMAALLLIVLVLVTQFNSVLQPGIIMLSVLLSMVGVLWGLIITGTPFGVIMTGIGVISLAGVVVNNAIILIDYTNILRRRGEPLAGAVIEAGATRLRPVLLTAVTTILGLLPMATGVGFDFIDMKLQLGGQSAEFWSPMAIAVIFGLAVATVLTLGVVPTLYYMFERGKGTLLGFFERHPRLRAAVVAFVILVLAQLAYTVVVTMIAATKGV